MPVIFQKAKVSNPARPKKAGQYEFLVDSGAVYSVMPEDDLRKLGIAATSHEEL